MPEYKVINDLQLVFYVAGELSNEAAVKISATDAPKYKVFILADEIRPLAEWLIKCADEIGDQGYKPPFTDEQADRESTGYGDPISPQCPNCHGPTNWTDLSEYVGLCKNCYDLGIDAIPC